MHKCIYFGIVLSSGFPHLTISKTMDRLLVISSRSPIQAVVEDAMLITEVHITVEEVIDLVGGVVARVNEDNSEQGNISHDNEEQCVQLCLSSGGAATNANSSGICSL